MGLKNGSAECFNLTGDIIHLRAFVRVVITAFIFHKIFGGLDKLGSCFEDSVPSVLLANKGGGGDRESILE
jgi:hypothetical protein